MAKLVVVEMLETRKGSPDGIRVEEYVIGQRYEFLTANSQDLAAVFVREEWAIERDPEVEAAEAAAGELDEGEAVEAQTPPETRQRAPVQDKQKPLPVQHPVTTAKRRRKRK